MIKINFSIILILLMITGCSNECLITNDKLNLEFYGENNNWKVHYYLDCTDKTIIKGRGNNKDIKLEVRGSDKIILEYKGDKNSLESIEVIKIICSSKCGYCERKIKSKSGTYHNVFVINGSPDHTMVNKLKYKDSFELELNWKGKTNKIDIIKLNKISNR